MDSLSYDNVLACSTFTALSQTNIAISTHAHGTELADAHGHALCVWNKTECPSMSCDAHLVFNRKDGYTTLFWIPHLSLRFGNKDTVLIRASN